MKIKILESIKSPFVAQKGDVLDVGDDVGIDLEQHGYAEEVFPEAAADGEPHKLDGFDDDEEDEQGALDDLVEDDEDLDGGNDR